MFGIRELKRDVKDLTKLVYLMNKTPCYKEGDECCGKTIKGSRIHFTSDGYKRFYDVVGSDNTTNVVSEDVLQMAEKI